MESQSRLSNKLFLKRIWATAGIVAFVLVVLWVVKEIFSVLLLILAAVLISLYFLRLSGLIHRKMHVHHNVSLLISVLGSFILLGMFFWLAGNKIAEQANQLSQTLPATIGHAKQQLNKSDIGQNILQKISTGSEMKKASSFIRSFFRSSFGVISDIYVILFLSLFFTVSPKLYSGGFIKLLPVQAQAKASKILKETSDTLAKWLKGKLFSMLIVAVLTAIGLLIIGMPMAFVLAIIAGILNFIPNFGPLIALIPAVLVGLMQGTTTALLVAGLYILVQILESNVITPQVQKRLISIPPALIIIAQLLMGVLTGGWGVLLTTPLIAILMVVVDELWISRQQNKND